MNELPTVMVRLRDLLAEPGRGARIVRGREPRADGRAAAVLILFSSQFPDPEPGQLDVVIVEKNAHLRSHAGQCAFPGGGVEPRDASSEETALREAREEVGVESSEVELLGILPAASAGGSRYAVTPVVGWWRTPRVLAPVDTGELAAVHHLRVADLVEPSHRVTWHLPSGHRGPAFVLGDLFIWGFTAQLLDGLFTLAGWAGPWDASRHEIVPERFYHRARG